MAKVHPKSLDKSASQKCLQLHVGRSTTFVPIDCCGLDLGLSASTSRQINLLSYSCIWIRNTIPGVSEMIVWNSVEKKRQTFVDSGNNKYSAK